MIEGDVARGTWVARRNPCLTLGAIQPYLTLKGLYYLNGTGLAEASHARHVRCHLVLNLAHLRGAVGDMVVYIPHTQGMVCEYPRRVFIQMSTQTLIAK